MEAVEGAGVAHGGDVHTCGSHSGGVLTGVSP